MSICSFTMASFHRPISSSWPKSANPCRIAQRALQPQDSRIPALLFRYRARHYPHTLNEQEQHQWRQHCSDYFDLHLPDYFAHLKQLAKQYDEDSRDYQKLQTLCLYIEQLV